MNTSAPESFPMLSRGKHRRPQDGACFMEMASVLAGARWSDSPACTHPLLARLARLVNDATPDDTRGRLAPLVPSVIGLTSDDRSWDDEIALLAASFALPLVAPRDQPALAAGVLATESMLADHERRNGGPLRTSSVDALTSAPEAARWADGFVSSLGPPRAREHPGQAIVTFAVRALADSGREDPAADLRDLLTAAIALCQSLARRAAAASGAVPARAPAAA
ncbi:MAG TPA: hypothetical protein VGK35_03650 [Actinotalea sp.]|jgi:hypothetical protein